MYKGMGKRVCREWGRECVGNGEEGVCREGHGEGVCVGNREECIVLGTSVVDRCVVLGTSGVDRCVVLGTSGVDRCVVLGTSGEDRTSGHQITTGGWLAGWPSHHT